jgi:hypothetical protein
MDVFATVIATAATVEACRAAQSGTGFICLLSATGAEPPTHYAGSGFMPQSDVDALSGLCSVTQGQHDPHAVIAAAGLSIVQPPI